MRTEHGSECPGCQAELRLRQRRQEPWDDDTLTHYVVFGLATLLTLGVLVVSYLLS